MDMCPGCLSHSEKNVTQLKHLFSFAQNDAAKVLEDPTDVRAHGCDSLLTSGRKNGVLEDPVEPLLAKSFLVVSMLSVVR